MHGLEAHDTGSGQIRRPVAGSSKLVMREVEWTLRPKFMAYISIYYIISYVNLLEIDQDSVMIMALKGFAM